MPLPNSWQFEAIGTNWTIQSDQSITAEIKIEIEKLVEAFNANYSRFSPDSIVRRMYDEPGRYTFSESHFPELYGLYVKLNQLTEGSVTPLVGNSLVQAGYDEHYKLDSFSKMNTVIPLENIQWDGAYSITTNSQELLDFGAAAKGLLVDQMSVVLEQSYILEWFIDGSGDSMHHAASSYTVGFEHPLDTTKLLGTVELLNESVCASATNRRAWKNGHHVIDGKSGQPTRDIIATWAIADSTMLADGLATALFFEWNELVSAYPEGAFLRMKSNGTIEMNQKMKERITLFNSSDL